MISQVLFVMRKSHHIVDITFINEVKELLNATKEKAKVAINVAMVYTYYEIGRRIVGQEQKGENRAEYGKEVLKQLSAALTKEFGKGHSVSNLKMMRQFYSVYSADRIGQPLVSELKSLPTTSDGIAAKTKSKKRSMASVPLKKMKSI